MLNRRSVVAGLVAAPAVAMAMPSHEPIVTRIAIGGPQWAELVSQGYRVEVWLDGVRVQNCFRADAVAGTADVWMPGQAGQSSETLHGDVKIILRRPQCHSAQFC